MLPTSCPPFRNHLPVQVHFGAGVASDLAAILGDLDSDRAVAIVDPAIVELAAIRALLDAVSETLTVAPGEPTVESVDRLGEDLRGLRPDAIVGIGGGSALDSAKGARLLAQTGESIRRFTWPGDPQPVPELHLPLVTIPTTAGTGSEVTGGIVMSDSARGIKVAAPSPHNRAQVCLVDPELTLSLPPGPTLYGGLDVLAQAIGSIVTATHTPVADAIALEALEYTRRALPAVVGDGADLDARSEMACASLLAGLAMNLSEAGTDHSLGHALGVRFGVAHGLSVAVMLTAAMEHDRSFVPERFERVADALHAPRDDTSDGSRAVTAVAELLGQVRCPTLRDLGVTEDDVSELTDLALAAWIPVQPGPWERADVEGAFRYALAQSARWVRA